MIGLDAMSVTHQPPYNFRRPAAGKSRLLDDQQFHEIEIDVKPDRVAFKHVKEGGNLQVILLWGSAVLFMLFVVSIIPAMKLTLFGNALAILVGVLLLATIGIISQAKVQTTTIELTPSGVRIEQGTAMDRELAEVDWSNLGTVELEPVDAKAELKGMHLELRPTQGEPIHALPGVAVGDLNAIRQAILKARRGAG